MTYFDSLPFRDRVPVGRTTTRFDSERPLLTKGLDSGIKGSESTETGFGRSWTE